MYKILKTDGRAKRAEFTTVHGTVQTPVFMNVGTAAAIKGAVATTDLKEIGTQIELSNTYHLHVRPGDEVVRKLGGLPKFMNWDRPILTDSGGFQVFISSRILMDGKFLWDRNRVCRSSRIWDLRLQWHSTSVRQVWQTGTMCSARWSVRQDGWRAARRK